MINTRDEFIEAQRRVNSSRRDAKVKLNRATVMMWAEGLSHLAHRLDEGASPNEPSGFSDVSIKQAIYNIGAAIGVSAGKDLN